VDALVGFLDGPRARGAFVLRCTMDPPWSVRIEDRAPLTLVAVLRGEAWHVADDAPPTRLGAGDIALIRGPQPYTVADRPATAPQVVILPGQVCATPGGELLAESMHLGVRTWGNASDGETTMLVGTYDQQGEISGRLLHALPTLAVLTADSWSCPFIPLLADEVVKDDPGQEVVLDRLLDLVLVASLRAWFARPESGAPAWYQAHADPVVGTALRLLHGNPAHPWTVASLARETGSSRAALARRFTELVGEPPMQFLANWRLALAADLLREPDATVGGVARQVGYGSPFALSTAFKRVRGVSPREHRAAARGLTPTPA
jgi:AraC-like DNA-binding protein